MLKFARIFQDGMTLQRNKPIILWGESDCKQKVAVTLNGTCISECELSAGQFMLLLPPQSATFSAILSIACSGETIVFRNVDIGEVWIAGGQSNMEFPLLHDIGGKEFIGYANDEHLRFYDVGKFSFDGEEKEGLKDAKAWDKWMSFYPETVASFSAVGFYFAHELRKKYKIPIAIVGCKLGGNYGANLA